MNATRTLRFQFLLTIGSVSLLHVGQQVKADPKVIHHVSVYDVDGRFGGWPANHGIWSWGNEILVGFSAGYYKDLGPDRHAIDRQRPEHHLLARSRDGGQNWQVENPAEDGVLIGNRGMRHGTVPPGYEAPEPVPCPGGIDFTHPDFALTARMSGVHLGTSRFYYSLDRGRHWQGPFVLPLFGQPGIAARTDYIVNGPLDCFLFLTAAKQSEREGRVICVRTTDGGATWRLISYVGPEPQGFAIMPSTVRTGSTQFLCARRRRAAPSAPFRRWIDLFRSNDNGRTWHYVNDSAPDTGEGNPPALIKLSDGRLCLTYGYRAPPFAIHARFSRDQGQHWSEPFIVRGEGASRDMGYPRTVERPDGRLVTVYYFHDKTDVDRKVIATIWDPGE